MQCTFLKYVRICSASAWAFHTPYRSSAHRSSLQEKHIYYILSLILRFIRIANNLVCVAVLFVLVVHVIIRFSFDSVCFLEALPNQFKDAGGGASLYGNCTSNRIRFSPRGRRTPTPFPQKPFESEEESLIVVGRVGGTASPTTGKQKSRVPQYLQK